MRAATNLALALVWTWFVAASVSAFIQFRKPSLLVFALAETLTVILFMVRRPPTSVSHRVDDWLFALGGTFAPLLFRPVPSPGSTMGEILVFAGALVQVGALLSLNRAYGIVPADRGVKTAGLYAVVRHPMYASYLVRYVGYVMVNASWWNLGVLIGALGLQVLRILAEERHLSQDEGYRSYVRAVRWRVVPGLF